MNTWTQLFTDKVHSFYRVPIEVAAADDNIFFGLKHHPFDIDGPWPLLAFLRDKSRPYVVTLVACKILPEDLDIEGFNPLVKTGSGITLEYQELADLVSILQEYSQGLPSTHRSNQKMFKRIEDSELADLCFNPRLFPRSKQDYYYQIRNPLVEAGDSTVAILLLGRNIHPSQMSSRLSLRIISFQRQELHRPFFNPLDDAFAYIHLDRSGLQEFASLLDAELTLSKE